MGLPRKLKKFELEDLCKVQGIAPSVPLIICYKRKHSIYNCI
jgi:hypothetical protein